MTKVDDLIAGTRDVISARRVFGEPYETDGVTFIPAAAIRGGGGAGEGDGGETASTGSGGGFGMIARPVGRGNQEPVDHHCELPTLAHWDWQSEVRAPHIRSR